MPHKLLFISLTTKCNRKCPYCPVLQWRDKPVTITFEQVSKFIDIVKPTCVEITGGEPTLVEWLDELCDYLEANNIVYLVKSNGLKRCRNQITAWHDKIDNPPKNYDKILIIQDPNNEWREKEKYCVSNNIPYCLVGYNNMDIIDESTPYGETETLFLCSDGHIKKCKEKEMYEKPLYITDNPDKFVWKRQCPWCKSTFDFFKFIV